MSFKYTLVTQSILRLILLMYTCSNHTIFKRQLIKKIKQQYAVFDSDTAVTMKQDQCWQILWMPSKVINIMMQSYNELP